MNARPLVHLIWLLPLAALVIYVGSPRMTGTIALARVRRLLGSALDPRKFTVLDDLDLPAGGGTVHVDVVVVSRCGIFVIDTVHRPGKIRGTRVQARWTERRWWRTLRFDNPVHANTLRIESLSGLLRMPVSRFHGFVAVSGPARLEGGLPDNVVTVPRLLARIRSENRLLLEPDEADRALRILTDSALKRTWTSRRQWYWARLALLLVFLTAAGLTYRRELLDLAENLQQQAKRQMAPEDYRPDGSPKSEIERWEDRLACSYSVDTERCACYEPAGGRAEISPARCRELAERGSVLRQ